MFVGCGECSPTKPRIPPRFSSFSDLLKMCKSSASSINSLNHNQFHQHWFSDTISWYQQNWNLPGKIYSTLKTKSLAAIMNKKYIKNYQRKTSSPCRHTLETNYYFYWSSAWTVARGQPLKALRAVQCDGVMTLRSTVADLNFSRLMFYVLLTAHLDIKEKHLKHNLFLVLTMCSMYVCICQKATSCFDIYIHT